MTDETTLYCYVHPTRPTLLRCNNCERPICVSCAIRTPTGYRCKECVSGQQKIFNTAEWYDYVLTFIVSAVLSGIITFIMSGIGLFLWLFVYAIGPIAGTLIGNVCRRVVKSHRSRWLNTTLIVGIIAGAIPMLIISGVGVFFGLAGARDNPASLFAVTPMLWQIIYLATALPIAYSQFSGMVFRR